MGMEGNLEVVEDLSDRKVAILDTSRARKLHWSDLGKLEKAEASPRLLELLGDGYTVYIASTRTRDSFDPEGVDRCFFELIPEEQIFGADPHLRCDFANSPGLIDLWVRVLAEVGIAVPDEVMEEEFLAWMSIRRWAGEQGIEVY